MISETTIRCIYVACVVTMQHHK